MTMFKKLVLETWAIIRKPVSAWWLLLALPFLVIVPFDDAALAHLRFPENSAAHKVAQVISSKGDFYNACIVLVLAFWISGLILRRKRLQLLALAMLLSCAIPGVISLAIRVTTGRPRPSLDVPDGLYGLRFKYNAKFKTQLPDYDYQSLPSGHATTAFATAIPVLVAEPVIGVPLTIAAVSVTWARFQLKRHRLSDLYMGLLFGSLFGAAFGLAAKKLSPK